MFRAVVSLGYCFTWVYTHSELLRCFSDYFIGAPGGWFVYLGDNPLINVAIQGLFFALSLLAFCDLASAKVVLFHLLENEQEDQAGQGLQRYWRTGLE